MRIQRAPEEMDPEETMRRIRFLMGSVLEGGEKKRKGLASVWLRLVAASLALTGKAAAVLFLVAMVMLFMVVICFMIGNSQ